MSKLNWEEPELSTLVGRTITEVEANNDTVQFTTSDGRRYELRHDQDCCEDVYIESIVGDLQDLVGEPLLVAECVTDRDLAPPQDSIADESTTWTFFKLDTRKGGVTVRFFGSSNGYYSETAELRRVE